MPQVSVIIPVYNTQNYLKKCLDSVCNQTLSDIEIICVNDCSTDNSLDILTEYSKKDSRIKLIDFKENKGAAIARNIGIDEAKGEYIGFVDSDDFIDLDFYEKLYSKAKDEGAEVVKGKLFLYDLETGKKYLEDWININNKIIKHKAYFYFTFTTAIYKRKMVIDNDIHFLDKLKHFEDPYFTIKANLYYKKLILVNDACYYYTNNPSSSSRKNISIEHIQSMANGARSVIELLNRADIEEAHYKIVFNFVLEQLLYWANRIECSTSMIKCVTDTLYFIFNNCAYPKNCLFFHFMKKKEDECRNKIHRLRTVLKKT